MIGLAITATLFVYGLAASVVRPFHALLVYVAFAILKPPALWHWSVPDFEYSRVLAIAILVGWLAHGCGGLRFGGGGRVAGLLALFLAWTVLGMLLAPQPGLAWNFVDAIAKVLFAFVIGLTLIDGPGKLRQLLWVIVVCHGYLALQFNLMYLAGNNVLHLSGFAGMDNNSIAIGLVTAFAVAFLLALRASRGFGRWIATGSAVLLLHAILFSFSRGAMVATAVAVTTAFFLVPRRPTTDLVFALCVVAGLALAGRDVQQRFATVFASGENRDESAESRLELWADCLDVMSKHPILGVGPDHWPTLAASYGWPANKEAHSLWMQLGAEGGLVGLFLLLAFYGSAMLGCWRVLRAERRWRRRRGPPVDPQLVECARIVFVSLTGFVVAAQFVSLEALEVPYFVAVLGAGTMKLHRRAAATVPVADVAPSGPFPSPNLHSLAGAS